jgi:hypothetical protein
MGRFTVSKSNVREPSLTKVGDATEKERIRDGDLDAVDLTFSETNHKN